MFPSGTRTIAGRRERLKARRVIGNCDEFPVLRDGSPWVSGVSILLSRTCVSDTLSREADVINSPVR